MSCVKSPDQKCVCAALYGEYKLPESSPPCFLLGVLVAHRRCEYFTQRVYSYLNIFDLLRAGGGLLQETVSRG